MEQIKRIENNAIDTAYYLERSSQLRRQALRYYLGTWLQNLIGVKVGTRQHNRREDTQSQQSENRAR